MTEVINVIKPFKLRLPNFDSCYPDAPSPSLFNGAFLGSRPKRAERDEGDLHISIEGNEVVYDFRKAGEYRDITFHQIIAKAVSWFTSQKKLDDIAKELDHPLDPELAKLFTYDPASRIALLEQRAQAFKGLEVFIGWKTRSIADPNTRYWKYVREYIGPPRTSEQLRIEAAAELERANAKLAEAAEREKLEREKPESVKTWEKLADNDAIPTFTDTALKPASVADQVNTIQPNTRGTVGAASGVNLRSGTFGSGQKVF